MVIGYKRFICYNTYHFLKSSSFVILHIIPIIYYTTYTTYNSLWYIHIKESWKENNKQKAASCEPGMMLEILQRNSVLRADGQTHVQQHLTLWEESWQKTEKFSLEFAVIFCNMEETRLLYTINTNTQVLNHLLWDSFLLIWMLLLVKSPVSNGVHPSTMMKRRAPNCHTVVGPASYIWCSKYSGGANA